MLLNFRLSLAVTSVGWTSSSEKFVYYVGNLVNGHDLKSDMPHVYSCGQPTCELTPDTVVSNCRLESLLCCKYLTLAFHNTLSMPKMDCLVWNVTRYQNIKIWRGSVRYWESWGKYENIGSKNIQKVCLI